MASTRKPLIAANWKMYKTPVEACAYAETFLPLVAGHTRDEIAICPPFLALEPLEKSVRGSGIFIGAQDMHSEKEGAFTGEISAPMLKSIGVSHVILGHSERRHYNYESDWDVNRKLHAAIRQQVTPIVCIGEVQEEREEGRTNDVLLRQIKIGLEGIKPDEAATIVIAYEPIWAIGSGQSASPEIADETHAFIRSAVRERLGNSVADGMRILYGGSVKPETTAALLSKDEIDGALVGGASLDPESFAKIVKY
nr:triose-phosphate isomerase [Acidipila sp. EB88]